MRQHLRKVIALAAAGGLLWLFLRNTDFHAVATEIGRARIELLVLALVTTAAAYTFRALRWQYLLQPIGTVHFGNALRTTVIGFAASALLPARAGEVLRPYLLARREGLSATAAFATIILERLLDTMMVLILFATFLLLFSNGLAASGSTTFAQVKLGGEIAGAISVVGLVAMFFLAGHPATLERVTRTVVRVLPDRLGEAAGTLVRAFAEGLAIVRQPGRLLISLVLSLPVWLSIAAGIWLVTLAFHIDMPFTGAFLIQALLVVGVAVPTPGAVGGFHYFYRLGVTTFYAAPNDRAVGAALVLHAISFVPVAITGLVLLAQEGLSLSRAGSLARNAEEAA
jgi:glycosyltransferase 2 family protein